MELSTDFLSNLKNAKSLLFFTGAGISAESGIATFRGKDGLWNKLKPQELASFDAFMKNPDMVCFDGKRFMARYTRRCKPMYSMARRMKAASLNQKRL